MIIFNYHQQNLIFSVDLYTELKLYTRGVISLEIRVLYVFILIMVISPNGLLITLASNPYEHILILIIDLCIHSIFSQENKIYDST